MKKVLLLLHEEAHFEVMKPLFDLLKSSGRFEPLVWIDERMGHFRLLDRCMASGVPVLNCNHGQLRSITSVSDALPDVGSMRADAISVCSRAARALAHLQAIMLSRLQPKTSRGFGWLIRIIFIRCCVMRMYSLLRPVQATIETIGRLARVLKCNRIAAVVMCEDNVEFNTAEWIFAARRVGATSIIVPYTIPNKLEFAVALVANPAIHESTSWLNRLVCRLFPRWKFSYGGDNLMRMPAHAILTKELAGTSPPHPWVLNSGSSDAIAVESAMMRRHYERELIATEKLVLTGSLADDLLFCTLARRDETRKAVLARHQLPDDRPFLLVAMPPDQGVDLMRRSEFSDFSELVRFWGETVAALTDWNVIIRPHPKTRPEELAPLKSIGVCIDWTKTAELVPLCDVYVASISATIRWAIACGIPVVNYDVYRYDLGDYREAPGVIEAHSKAEFVDSIRRITTNQEVRKSLADLQKAVSADWACLDGHSGDRVLQLIDRVYQ